MQISSCSLADTPGVCPYGWGLLVCCRAVMSECKIESLQCCVSRRDVPLVRPKIQGDRSAFMPERKRKYVGRKPPVGLRRTHLGCVPTFGVIVCVLL